MLSQHEQTIIERLRTLPRERVAEVEDFIDFLHERQQIQGVVNASSRLSETVFHEIWDNPDDSDYDRL
jgi:hypothetical protein